MKQIADIKDRFRNRYNNTARVFRAPGRVNLIGEHTDYNDGFVMPAAIDFYTWVAIASRSDRRIVVHSENLGESAEFDLDAPASRRRHWSDYVFGVALDLDQAGHRLGGADMLILGEVPIGSGLSSSAAIEVSAGYGLLRASGLSVNRVELALICQRAENEFVGMRCGIMDQFISCSGRAGKALMLDCRSLDYKLVPMPPEVSLVICNTMVGHELATGEYNKRRGECEAGVRELAKHLPHVKALRDVTMADLERYGGGLPDVILRRCRHVVSEDDRVMQAAAALDHSDLATFGELMAQSHRSLVEDYEVSCDELNLMVSLAASARGVIGARMTGGGFGGCTINLVESAHVEEFRQSVAAGYEKGTGRKAEIYVSTPAEGAAEVESG